MNGIKEKYGEISPKRLFQLEQSIQTISSAKIPERVSTLEDSINKVMQENWQTKEVLTTSETAAYLGISESYLYKLTSNKLIPHYKPNGRLVYFKKEELAQWVLRNPIIVSPNNQSAV